MKTFGFILGLLVSFYGFAGIEDFRAGPLIQEYGKHTKVEQDFNIPESFRFKVVFDLAESAGKEKLNRKFDSLARFINMHVANGTKPENIELAMVVHGTAGADLLNTKAFMDKFQTSNPNRALLQLLMKHNVQIILCGQSAAFHNIKNADLIDGVQMSLSAMTAHALLQQQGFHLNPF